MQSWQPLTNKIPRPKAEPEKWLEPKRLAELRGKKPFLQIKLKALENAHAEVMAANAKLRDLLNEDIRGFDERMHGLLSYGIAMGRTNPNCRVLYDSLGDYLGAKFESDRMAAKKAVNLCLAHGNFDSTEDESIADDEVLRRLEAISDPGDRSRFYSKHQKEILAAFETRNIITRLLALLEAKSRTIST
jgi:hypothetical protein